jgi:hypothetical protein
MPYFEVRLHCRGIDVPMEGQRARGFFTNRVVRASDPEAARAAAVDTLRVEWERGPHAALNRSGEVSFEPEEVFSLGAIRGFLARQGYAFYTEEI